jgi:hypothetical protein
VDAELVVVLPEGFAPPELGVVWVSVVLIGALPEEPDDGLVVGGGELEVLVVLVEVVVVEVFGGRLAEAEVGTVSGETPLVSAAVVAPPLPQPAAALAARVRATASPIRHRKLSAIPLTIRAGPSACRSGGSR